MSEIENIVAREILDSRGYPTVEVDVTLLSGAFGRASVPSGASTGKHEAIELRDHDPKRFCGKGVLKAISLINEKITPELLGFESICQITIDQILCEIDNTDNKSFLGANATLAVSLAVAKATAIEQNIPLYRYLGGVHSHYLPIPMMNIINGGCHADNAIDIQEFMIMPIGAKTFLQALQMGSETFSHLKSILKTNGYNTNVGDEGGFAPELKSTTQALDFILEAIHKAGYKAGDDIGIALDVAATELYRDGKYHIHDHDGKVKSFSDEALSKFYESLIRQYPIFSIEDGFSEDDWEGWSKFTQDFGDQIQIVGDDLFVTNSTRLKRGIEENIANAILIKPNQIGTLTETLSTIALAQSNGYNCVISHRSGETEDTTIADIAVATNAGQIKTGSLSRSERLAKYNQLIRIEEDPLFYTQYIGHNIIET